MTCSACGAVLRTGDSWCGQCYAPVSTGMPASAGYAPVGRHVVQQTLAHQETWTRWRKTDTTFGPVGRVAITLVIVLVAAFSIVSGDIFAIGPLCFILPPLVLRSVWAKGRVT